MKTQPFIDHRFDTPNGLLEYRVTADDDFRFWDLRDLRKALHKTGLMDLALTYPSGVSHVYSRDFVDGEATDWTYRIVYAKP